MNKLIAAALMAATLAVPASPAYAGEHASERRSVDARVAKVRLGGVIDLQVRQGAAPSLVVYGEKRHLAKITISQDGDTLRIDSDQRGLHFGRDSRHLRAELTLPNLNELVSHGVGSSEVNGFSGEEFTVVLDGAGAVTINGRYKKMNARLGGVGSMTLNPGDSERVDLNLRGAGQIAVSGQARLLRARLGGVGSLDAQGLRADTVDLDMSGLGGATVFARNSANLKLSGLGSATVYGKPANRTSTSQGLGSVSWE